MPQQSSIIPIMMVIAHYLAASVCATQATTLVTQTTGRAIPEVPASATITSIPESTVSPILSSVSLSSLITIAPVSRNPLELRQKCFNDQGFSVNCATWTGYYYTWGGAGHPYAGGPGDSGSGSTSTNGGTSSASRADRERVLVMTTLIMSTVLAVMLAM